MAKSISTTSLEKLLARRSALDKQIAAAEKKLIAQVKANAKPTKKAPRKKAAAKSGAVKARAKGSLKRSRTKKG
ncbi:hypothetical protein AGMMS49587_05510 [Spirochaetia bacterium]|nr:hypothetical protein AGMMS49587_05510 [Spirochaetia bacterium]